MKDNYVCTTVHMNLRKLKLLLVVTVYYKLRINWFSFWDVNLAMLYSFFQHPDFDELNATLKSLFLDSGWYPELVFLSVVFSNNTVSAVVIPTVSDFVTLFTFLSRGSLRNLIKLHVLYV